MFPVIAGVVAVVVTLSVIATAGEPLLPIILVGGNYARLTSLGIAPMVTVFSLMATILVAARLRRSSVLSIWLTVATIAATADIVLTLLGSIRFTFAWYLARGLSLVAGFAVLVALLTDFIWLFNKVAAANLLLEKLSMTDALTGIGNRRAFEQNLEREWRRAIREQLPLSLVMIDIDHFKRYNDRFGHPEGDICLRAVAVSLTSEARRPLDMPARLGGEEFGILLPQTEAEGAFNVAETFRISIEKLAMPHPDNLFQVVTISVGVATVYPYAINETQQGLIEVADAALYAAKISGRNRVSQHFPPELESVIDKIRNQLSGKR